MSGQHNIFETVPLSGQQEAQWISLSDLMTGLMMVFMLIAVTFMLKVEADATKARQVAILYDEVRQELYQDLYSEFKSDLSSWGAELNEENLSIRFKEPDVLFNRGEDALKSKFQNILKEFFPRYIKIITAEKYKDSIEEIRIEGHTSSIWNGSVTTEEAYFLNMGLSQSRTRSTLRYVLGLETVQPDLSWLRQKMTANGLSSINSVTVSSVNSFLFAYSFNNSISFIFRLSGS